MYLLLQESDIRKDSKIMKNELCLIFGLLSRKKSKSTSTRHKMQEKNQQARKMKARSNEKKPRETNEKFTD